MGRGAWPGRSVGVGTRGSGVKACAGKGVGWPCEETDRLQPGVSSIANARSARTSSSADGRRRTRRILSHSLCEGRQRGKDG